MRESVSLEPVVETEVVLELRIDQIGNLECPEGQLLTGMVNGGKGIRLNRNPTRHGRSGDRLDEERQIWQPLDAEFVVVAVGDVCRLKRERRFVVLVRFHVVYLGASKYADRGRHMAGASAERQERGVINTINGAVKKNQNNPVSVKAGKMVIDGVISARKYGGRQLSGSEPYTDVELIIEGRKEPYRLSLKGEAAPSLAGGGLRGLELAVPGIAAKFMRAAHAHLTKKMKLKRGAKVPDVYGMISESDKLKIVIGNAAMGGPIDFMYIGPMDVRTVTTYDPKHNVLELNGHLTKSKEYAKTHTLYFRLRARREDQRFDPDAKDSSGVPKIYGKSPSRGDSAGRIVITDSTPANAVIVRF